MLLDGLFRAQEPVVKMILDRLYDVGSIHLIDQKVPARLPNRVTKAIAPGVKPIARTVGFIWFRKNCPKLIANWLYRTVSSGQSLPLLLQELEDSEKEMLARVSLSDIDPVSTLPPGQPAQLASNRTAVESSNQEIRKLRSQVQFLLGALVGTVMLLGSTTLWLMRDSAPTLLSPAESSATACLDDLGCQEAAEVNRNLELE
ncbi:MAG: hypothetical protein ACFB5Z_11240 [Elainellaceae cyanobacterium]